MVFELFGFREFNHYDLKYAVLLNLVWNWVRLLASSEMQWQLAGWGGQKEKDETSLGL